MIFLPIAALGALALFSLLMVFLSLGPYARVLRRPTRTVASLASLASLERGGPAEIAGTIRAREAPLIAVDGTPAVAMKTILSYSYRSGGKAYKGSSTIDARAVAADLYDDTGTCALALDSVVLIGTTRTIQMEAGRFAEEHPELFALLSPAETLNAVTAVQTYVEDGAIGMASGEVEPDHDRAAPGAGDGYRGSSPGRLRLTSATDRPLLLAHFAEPKVRARLLRPAWLFAAIALGATAVASSLLFVAFAFHG